MLIYFQEVADFIRASAPSEYGQQYAAVFEGNFIDGKRFLKLKINHLPQMGIQRFDHMKLVFKKIEKVPCRIIVPTQALRLNCCADTEGRCRV